MKSFQPEIIKQLCLDSGFDLVGFARADLPTFHRDYIKKWVSDGKYGKMNWFPKQTSMDIRIDHKNLGFTPASVLCLAMVYRSQSGEDIVNQMEKKVSRYALGEDYHTVMRKKAKPILSYLKDSFPGYHFRQSVDTLPILEKVFAKKSGIGWMGKNTNIIHPELGSYFFLSTILTDCPWDIIETPLFDHCGSCRACLDACPTGALSSYEMDARLCISHHTIENRDENLKDDIKLSNWIYGCDICQEVCPWNKNKARKNSIETKNKEFLPTGIFLNHLEKMDEIMEEDKFKESFKTSSIYRIGVNLWNRNLKKLKE